ncbi:hypothetical protein HPULCUR_006303 [Helicostylum pulchrum]|uniref:Uncharacterized protein n=1 Tax=Helicostylum pulchrum TaxID=562976 RepID=A0ABP9Y1J0_9FUNG
MFQRDLGVFLGSLRETLDRPPISNSYKQSKLNIYNSIKVHGVTISSISKDCKAIMNSVYIRYHGSYRLGEDELCDHIQIDEFKFGNTLIIDQIVSSIS